MTRTAESNAILRVSIFLHIINVVDALAALATDCAGIVVALSDYAFECTIERWGIWLERKPALPRMGIGSRLVNRPPFIMTLSGAKSSTIVAWVNKKPFSTTRANLGFGSTSPPRRPVSFKFMRRMTGLRAIKSCLPENLVDKIRFATIETHSFDLSTLPVSSPLASSVRCCTRLRATFGRVFAERVNLKALTTMLAYYLDLGFTVPVRHLAPKRSTPYAARIVAHTVRAQGVHVIKKPSNRIRVSNYIIARKGATK